MEEFYLAGGLDGENSKYAGSVYFDQQRATTFEHSTSFDPKKIKDLEQVYKLAEKSIEGYYQWLEVYGHDFQYENFRAEDKLSMTGPHGSILNPTCAGFPSRHGSILRINTSRKSRGHGNVSHCYMDLGICFRTNHQ